MQVRTLQQRGTTQTHVIRQWTARGFAKGEIDKLTLDTVLSQLTILEKVLNGKLSVEQLNQLLTASETYAQEETAQLKTQKKETALMR